MSRHDSVYGSWKSPVTSEMVASEVLRLGQIELEGKDIYWHETRLSEAGRGVIVKHSLDGLVTDVSPSSFNVRTRVHEYGGGAYEVNGKVVYFTHFKCHMEAS